jgi:hypothetical protein
MGTKLGFSPKNMADIIAGAAWLTRDQMNQAQGNYARGSQTTLPFLSRSLSHWTRDVPIVPFGAGIQLQNWPELRNG